MKHFINPLIALTIFILAIAITGCGDQSQTSTKEAKDPFVGTWYAIVDNADKSIEEITIEKEKDAYFIKSSELRYTSNACINSKGKYDKDANGKMLCTLTLERREILPKTNANIKGNTLVVPQTFGTITITPKENKLSTTGALSEKEVTFEKTDKSKLKNMVNQHLERYSKGPDISKGWSIKVDNSIIEK